MKKDEWGYPTCNALFCTHSDQLHVKQTPQTILETAKEYLGAWAMSITPEVINVAQHEDSVYRAQATDNEDGLFQISGANEESVPTFNTRTGEEVSVPAEHVVPAPCRPSYLHPAVDLNR